MIICNPDGRIQALCAENAKDTQLQNKFCVTKLGLSMIQPAKKLSGSVIICLFSFELWAVELNYLCTRFSLEWPHARSWRLTFFVQIDQDEDSEIEYNDRTLDGKRSKETRYFDKFFPGKWCV